VNPADLPDVRRRVMRQLIESLTYEGAIRPERNRADLGVSNEH